MMPEARIENRRHDRYQVQAAGILRVENSPGDVFVVTVIDVSKEGFRTSCSKDFPMGTPVELQCRGVKIRGEVRYAINYGIDQFYLGVAAQSAVGGATSQSGELDLTLLFRKAALRPVGTWA